MSDRHMSDGQNATFSQHNQKQIKEVDTKTLSAEIPDYCFEIWVIFSAK